MATRERPIRGRKPTQTPTTLGPADHGRPITARLLDRSELLPGFKYEMISGRLYVSPQPNVPENLLEEWLGLALRLYAKQHPNVINFVTGKARVYISDSPTTTRPEPDIAAYSQFPLERPRRQVRWQDVSPILVVEILVDGDIAKDLERNPELYLSLPSISEYWVINGAEDAERPTLIQHRRRGKKWVVTTFPFGSTFTTRLLPGFSLELDPRK